MNKDFFLFLFLVFFVSGCSSFEFVYKSPKNIEIKDKTIISTTGDDSDIVVAHVNSKINKSKNDPEYLLIIYSQKSVEAAVIDKDATASKFNLEYVINYKLRNLIESCMILDKTISSASSYNTKSGGYSFGSDLSEKEVANNLVKSNIDNFFEHLSISEIDLECKNEG